MKIQSFSVVVPNKECINKCPFCVSRMVDSNRYPNLMDINHPHYDINVREYLKRMRYIADGGCRTMMLTGTSEPQQNKQFLATLALLHQQIGSPFTNIEMQTTGVMLDNNTDYLRFLRNFVGVNTIAISVNAIDKDINNVILGHSTDGKLGVDIKKLCESAHSYDFNIRLCFNLNNSFTDGSVVSNPPDPYQWFHFHNWFKFAKECFASQLTIRKLYSSEENTPQCEWIKAHQPDDGVLSNFESTYLKDSCVIGETPYGNKIYDINGMSVIYDNDCMGKNPKTDTMKYAILRPNCKLYYSWDSEASLIF